MSEPADPTCVILPRRRGRPPAPPTAAISTRLSLEDADRLVRLALQHDLKVAQLVRELLLVSLHD